LPEAVGSRGELRNTNEKDDPEKRGVELGVVRFGGLQLALISREHVKIATTTRSQHPGPTLTEKIAFSRTARLYQERIYDEASQEPTPMFARLRISR
jgi:hypothetical protein